MEITGRITKDAAVSKLKDDREVVNFSVAINDSYKTKGSSEVKKFTTYFNCAYWVSSSIAKLLTKGTLVQLYGRISVNVYNDLQGSAKASLNFHVNNIKLLGRSNLPEKTPATAAEITEPLEDLPF